MNNCYTLWLLIITLMSVSMGNPSSRKKVIRVNKTFLICIKDLLLNRCISIHPNLCNTIAFITNYKTHQLIITFPCHRLFLASHFNNRIIARDKDTEDFAHRRGIEFWHQLAERFEAFFFGGIDPFEGVDRSNDRPGEVFGEGIKKRNGIIGFPAGKLFADKLFRYHLW